MVAMCATIFSACSDDDKDPLDDDGEGKEGVITMVCEDYHYEIYLGVETFKEGEIVTVDWGDGNVEEFKSIKLPEGFGEYWDDYDVWPEFGEQTHYAISTDYNVEHEYSSSNPHLITIKGNIKGVTPPEYTTELDVSKCTALTYLNCSDELTSLDVSKNTELTHLSCGYNSNLTSLDVSKNTKLTALYCGYSGNLTSLNVSKNTALTWLNCGYNNLTSLDVSKNTALTNLDCGHNNLTSAALNQIFRDLPQGKTWTDKYGNIKQSTISIYDNPGSNTCDKSIVKNKGWITKY